MKEKVILAIIVDPDYAYRESQFARDMRADGVSLADTVMGDVAVLLMQDDIIETDKQVEDVSVIANLAAEAANLLRNLREKWAGSDGALDLIMQAELNLERILDRVSVVTGEKK